MSERVSQGVPQPQGFGEDPLTQFSRLFVKFLQVVFASFEKGAYRWDKDEKNSDITISDQATINKEVVEKRPAIIVSRGPAAFANVALDQFAGPLMVKQPDGTFNFTPNDDPTNGAKRHTDLISASMTYNCLSSEGIEAQRIAWISMYATRVLKKFLLSAGLHRVGEEIQVGAESPPGAIISGDANEIILVAVQVPFYFQDTWTKTPLNKTLLTKVAMALSSEVGWPAPGAKVIKEPGINGKVLWYDKVLVLNQKIAQGLLQTPKPRK